MLGLFLMSCPPVRRLRPNSCEAAATRIAAASQLSSLEAGNERFNLCGVSRILVWIFLYRQRRRFYAARGSEARTSEPFLSFSSSIAASTHFSGCPKKSVRLNCDQKQTLPADETRNPVLPNGNSRETSPRIIEGFACNDQSLFASSRLCF